jgi:hypothetical protein
VDVDMRAMRDRRARLVSERDRLERRLAELPTGRRRNGADPFVVATVELIPHIVEWLEMYEEEMGHTGLGVLAERARLNPRSLRSMINPRYQSHSKYTTLAVADDVVCALSRPGLLEKLHIVPNPYYYKAAGGEGCG